MNFIAENLSIIYWTSVFIIYFILLVYDDIQVSQDNHDYFFHYRGDGNNGFFILMLIYFLLFGVSTILPFIIPLFIILILPFILLCKLVKGTSKFIQMSIMGGEE